MADNRKIVVFCKDCGVVKSLSQHDKECENCGDGGEIEGLFHIEDLVHIKHWIGEEVA